MGKKKYHEHYVVERKYPNGTQDISGIYDTLEEAKNHASYQHKIYKRKWEI